MHVLQLSNSVHSACTRGVGHFCFPHVPLRCDFALGWRMLLLLPLLLHVPALLTQQRYWEGAGLPPVHPAGFLPYTHTHTLSSLSFNNMGVLGGQGGMWWEVTEVLSFSIKGKIQSDLKQHSKFIILLCTPV